MRRRYFVSRHAIKEFEKVLKDGFIDGLTLRAVRELTHESGISHLQRLILDEHLHEHVRHREWFRGRGKGKRAFNRRRKLVISPFAGLFDTTVRTANEFDG